MREIYLIRHQNNRWWDNDGKCWTRNPAMATEYSRDSEYPAEIDDFNEISDFGVMVRQAGDKGNIYTNSIEFHSAEIVPYPTKSKIFESNGNYTDIDVEFDPHQSEYQFELTAYNTDQQPGRVVIHLLTRIEVREMANELLNALGDIPPDYKGD
jgi:hypothetical protein